ncbi:MAG: hypothetical protein IJM83_04370 [Firmicutes bacterium]|nr:hypothetical protein [Bacillota bacterium]
MIRLTDRKEWILFWFISWFLVALALFQIGRIFWAPLQKDTSAVTDESVEVRSSMISPKTIYISLKGQTGFVGVPDGTGDHLELLAESLALLHDVMPASILMTEEESELPLLGTVCCLDLPLSLGAEAIRAEMDVPENRFPDGSFDQIWIVPARSLTEDVRICFYNTNDKTLRISAGGSYTMESNQSLLKTIVDLVHTVDTDYVWQELAFPGVFPRDGFLQTEGRSSGTRGQILSAFLQDETMIEVRMRRYGMSFFDYPDTVSEKTLGEDLLLSNEKMTVRLSPDGHMVYVQTLTGDEKTPVGLSEAYDTAAAFIRKDMASQSGIGWKLSGYETIGEETVFYFDYVIDGYLCPLDESLQEEWSMPAPIVVTISGSKVRRYERFVCTVQMGEISELRYNWKEIMDRCAREEIEVSEPPRLSYQMTHGQLFLVWTIKGPDETLYYPAL